MCIRDSLLDRDDCARTHACIRALNRFYLEHPALWDNDEDWDGFSWLVADDRYSNVLVFQRTARDGRSLICAVNFAPLAWENYRFGVSGGAQVWQRCSTPTSCAGAAAASAMPRSRRGRSRPTARIIR